MSINHASRLAVVIPAYKPSAGLVDVVRSLCEKGLPAIVIVDDGSGPDFQKTFSAAAAFPNVEVLRHAVNLGKGAALKTAFNYVLCTFPGLTGVVTADADGQHHPDDIERVGQRLMERPDCLVLGSRTFGREVPLRSRFGNIATRGIMHALLGRKFTDTQTGLRGIPASLLARLMRVESTGYEFELEMLMAAHHLALTVVEEPIRTIYEAGNLSSHFNPLIDSMKIYFVLLRFGSVSLITALIDNLVFIVAQSRGASVLTSQILGRILAIAFNYWMARTSVFYSKQAHMAVLPKYLTLVLASGAISYACIRTLSTELGVNPIPAKIMVETVLFFANFLVQRLLIFKPQEDETPAGRRSPVLLNTICAVVFFTLIAVEWHGFRTAHLFAQDIWFPIGLKRFEHYMGAYIALSVPLLVMLPWMFAGLMAVLLAVLSALAIGPQAVFATGFFFVSACALGSKLLRAKEDSVENHLLATLLGAAGYIFLMTFLARQPVNYPATWAGILAVPLLLDWRGVRRRLLVWLRLLRDAELSSTGQKAAFALLVFVMVAHWLVALKPEASADGLAMHLAIPFDIATHHRMTFEPSRFLWAVMPLGADWCYAIVYLLGGEYAAHLLVWSFLAILAALLYGILRRLVTPATALLLVALFATTPLVQLVTGSLFVENLLAAIVFGMLAGLWRFSETGERKFLYLAMALGGTALTIKIGALAFLMLALVFAGVEIARHWRRLGPRPWAVCVVALALTVAMAAPTYAIAYAKTGNPLFPFLNRRFPSPLLDSTVEVTDDRFQQPLRWTTLYDMTFHTSNYYECQNGSFGFQYLVIFPLAVLGVAVIRRRATLGTGLIGIGAALLILRSTPNARYVYSALPLWYVPFAGILGWMSKHQRWLYRLAIVFLVACAALNTWFLPTSGYYQKDFCLRLPFSRAERERYLRDAVPIRDVIAYYNRSHPGAAVLFTHDSTIAGTSGEIYENHWHQWRTFDRIRQAFTVPEMLQLMRSWKVDYFIAHKPTPDDPIRPKALAKLIEVCTVPEYERRDTYLARLDPACDPSKLTLAARPATLVASPGFYDDFDPIIVYRGEWARDESFAEPAGHTVSYTDIPGAEVAFAFDGQALNWIFTKAPNRGIAEVVIDGETKGMVDLYSTAIEWQRKARFCCFAAGKHMVTIRVTGQAHAKSTGRFVDVDGFVVEGRK